MSLSVLTNERKIKTEVKNIIQRVTNNASENLLTTFENFCMYSSCISTVVCFLAVQCPFLLVSLNLPFATSPSKTTDMNHRESTSLGLRRLFPGTRPIAAAPIYCAFVTAPDTDEAPEHSSSLVLPVPPQSCTLPNLYRKGRQLKPPTTFFLSTAPLLFLLRSQLPVII